MLAKGSRILLWLIRTYPYPFLIFLTFIIIFGVTFRITYFRYEDAVDTAIHRNKSIASSSARIIYESLEKAIVNVRSYASRPLIIKSASNKDPKEIIRHLASMKNDNPEIDIVFVTDRNGKLWANFPVSKETHGKDFSQYDWYKHASQERESYVSHVYQGIKGEDKPAIAVCSPLLDMKGEVIGILAVYQRIALMRHLADALIWDPDLKISLIDRAGQIIYSNRYPYEKESIHYPFSRLVKKAREEGKWDLTVEDPSEGGEIKFLAFEPIKGIGWSIIVEKAKKEIFHSVIGRIIEYSVVALLLFVFFVLSLAYLKKELISRELAEQKKAEQVLLERERETQRLAKENAVMAEIGRIISATLNIEEVYDRFAEEVGKLIPFDRIAISIINDENNTFTIPYNSGIEIPGRRTGDVIPLGGTTTEEVVRTRCGLLVREENREELMGRVSGVLFLFREGFRSLLSIPLISKDQVIGALILQSKRPDAYTEKDLGLAMRVGTQIAGIIANAQLFLERKQAEEVLREAEERFRLLFEILTDGVLIRDREGIIRLANPTAVKMLKASRLDEIIGKAYLDFVHPEDRPGSIDRIQRLIKEVQEEPGIISADKTAPLREHRLLTLDGESVYVESTGTGFRHQGQVWIQGSFHDITKRKEAEEALRKSEEVARRRAKENAIVAEIGRIISSTLDIENIYERFAEQARELIPCDHIAITTIDREKGTLHIAFVSGYVVPGRGRMEVVSLAGTFNEEAASSRSIQLIQTEDAEEVEARFPKLLPFWQHGFRSFMAVPLISNDQLVGVLNFYSMRSRAYKEADANLAKQIAAQIAGAIANAQLYAGRKRVEEALSKREEEARKLANENAIVAKIGRIISSSFSIEEAYKLFMEEVRNLLSFDRIVVNMIDAEKKSLVNPFVKGIPAVGREQGEVFPIRGTLMEAVIRTEKGLIIGVEDEDEVRAEFPGLLPEFRAGFRSFLSVPLISRNQVVGGLHLRSRKFKAYAEEDLRLAECVANQIAGAVVNAQLFTVQKSLESRLMQAQKLEAIGTLAAGIAHDFNNILAAIVGYAELINWEVRRGSKAERNLQELLKASGRARDLVQQILTFSRESRQERKPLEIKPVVKESLKLLRASLPSSIEIREEIENDIGKIEADPTQIHQILMNLCTNAAHAMRKNGGLLKVSLSNVDMDASTAAQYPNILPGPFIRLSVSDTGHGMSPEVLARIFDPYFTTKEVDEGTGLGLAVVHGIVESYRGAITVYSEPGSGTTFHVYFPQIDHAKEVAVTQKVEPLLMGKNERILFIDDEQALVDVGEQILKSLRYEVTIGTSSIEALELFRKQPERFDLVITDMTMPNMTGDKLAKELLRIRPDIPIVLCTGYNERITGEAAKEMGIREFAMKPLVASDLAKTIRRALDQQKEKWPEYES